MSADTRRHQRQRSSVQVKKRISVQRAVSPSNNGVKSVTSSPRFGNIEIKDNALSDRIEPKDNILSANTSPTFFNTNQITEDLQINIENNGTQNSEPDYFNQTQTVSEHDVFDRPEVQMHSIENDQNMLGDMTTRSELSLFEDEDTSASGERSGPDVPSIESGSAPDSPTKRFNLTTPKMQSRDTMDDSFNSGSSNSMFNSADYSTPTSTSKKGTKRLSLLTNGNNSIGSPASPSTSPRAIRTPTTSTPRSGRKAHRMSLGYFASPGPQSSITPSIQTPPIMTATTSSSNDMMHGPRSASISTNASVDSVSIKSTSLRQNEDGETILMQHKGVLERIAEKERAILELKEVLKREENELKMLRKEFEKTAARELTETNELENKDTFNSMSTPSSATAASDTFKGISAKLQNGIGTQLNAFLDQLVAIPDVPTENVQKVANKGDSLTALIEEDDEEGNQLSSQNRSDVIPALPSKSVTRSRNTAEAQPKSHSKRTSMFGASFAAFQKQMEQQFSGPPNAADNRSGPADSNEASKQGPIGMTNEFSWGGFQKRLKEARENASGLLATVEAKIGQAMTIDDLLHIEDPDANIKSSKLNNDTGVFAEENDREKAALAELGWLNSLAGVKTSGSVDRITTSLATPEMSSSSSRFASNSNLNQQNLLKLEDVRNIGRASSPASSSQSTTRPHQSPRKVQSPPLGVAQARRTSASGVRPMKESEKKSTGFFDALSAVWSAEKPSSPNQTTSSLNPSSNNKRYSGQNRTRMAARAAVHQGDDTSMSPSTKTSAIEAAWDWDAPLSTSEQKEAGQGGIGIGLLDIDVPSTGNSKAKDDQPGQDLNNNNEKRKSETRIDNDENWSW